MKFAVVEYSSKTGDIWKHTPERPNYVCDPIKEIDPTSFGCYVSALEGEHIPLTTFITGKRSHTSSAALLYRKVVKRLTGRWPQYDISYFKQFDALLIVHQVSDGHEVTTFTKRLKEAYPHIVILGVPTQPYGLLKAHWETHHEWLKDFKEFMTLCDVFLTIVESTKKEWQNMTATPVEYVPQPYPTQYASQFFKPYSKKKKIIFVAGVTNRPNIPKGQAVAKELQLLHPSYLIHVTQTPGEALDTNQLQDTQYEIMPFQPWNEQLEYVSEVSLVINTDYTQTRGRVQTDCAAVGTPSIGADSDGQVDLFPVLKADAETSVDELVRQGHQLLTDHQFYDSITQTALQRLEKYNYEQSAQRLRALIQKVKSKSHV